MSLNPMLTCLNLQTLQYVYRTSTAQMQCAHPNIIRTTRHSYAGCKQKEIAGCVFSETRGNSGVQRSQDKRLLGRIGENNSVGVDDRTSTYR